MHTQECRGHPTCAPPSCRCWLASGVQYVFRRVLFCLRNPLPVMSLCGWVGGWCLHSLLVRCSPVPCLAPPPGFDEPRVGAERDGRTLPYARYREGAHQQGAGGLGWLNRRSCLVLSSRESGFFTPVFCLSVFNPRVEEGGGITPVFLSFGLFSTRGRKSITPVFCLFLWKKEQQRAGVVDWLRASAYVSALRFSPKACVVLSPCLFWGRPFTPGRSFFGNHLYFDVERWPSFSRPPSLPFSSSVTFSPAAVAFRHQPRHLP